jgi:hypothetical protein
MILTMDSILNGLMSCSFDPNARTPGRFQSAVQAAPEQTLVQRYWPSEIFQMVRVAVLSSTAAKMAVPH